MARAAQVAGADGGGQLASKVDDLPHPAHEVARREAGGGQHLRQVLPGRPAPGRLGEPDVRLAAAVTLVVALQLADLAPDVAQLRLGPFRRRVGHPGQHRVAGGARLIDQGRQHRRQLGRGEAGEHVTADALGSDEVEFVVDASQHGAGGGEGVAVEVAEVAEDGQDTLELDGERVGAAGELALHPLGLPLEADHAGGLDRVDLAVLTGVAGVCLQLVAELADPALGVVIRRRRGVGHLRVDRSDLVAHRREQGTSVRAVAHREVARHTHPAYWLERAPQVVGLQLEDGVVPGDDLGPRLGAAALLAHSQHHAPALARHVDDVPRHESGQRCGHRL